ncbi:DUF1003 domain-containing protein [Actinoallomurus sp. CA-150999]|uniref:DUF1003 domain-containing protein n=1 Tax=Actinoallomurus sp. CA-150999 TaxID=3239887 RepID=UPI003D90191A
MWEASAVEANQVKVLRNERLALLRKRRRVQDRVADQITAFSGSMPFVYIHMVWFTGWILVNSVGSARFDPYPYGLLTLIVSLEAIFLSTFVMLSQNREALRSDLRSEIDFETNVLSEVWLEAVAEKLGIEVEQVHASARERIAEAKARQEQAAGRSG